MTASYNPHTERTLVRLPGGSTESLSHRELGNLAREIARALDASTRHQHQLAQRDAHRDLRRHTDFGSLT